VHGSCTAGISRVQKCSLSWHQTNADDESKLDIIGIQRFSKTSKYQISGFKPLYVAQLSKQDSASLPGYCPWKRWPSQMPTPIATTLRRFFRGNGDLMGLNFKIRHSKMADADLTKPRY
jgi:hypothetical protein